jgi:UDP-glucose 4-epimerase
MPMPLPLGGLAALRSLLSVDNLVEAIECVLALPGPLRRPLIVADSEPLTVPAMIAAMRAGLGRRPGLFSVPPSLLRLACQATGRLDLYHRATAALVADASALRALGWVPSIATHAGLAALMWAEGNGLKTGVGPE